MHVHMNAPNLLNNCRRSTARRMKLHILDRLSLGVEASLHEVPGRTEVRPCMPSASGMEGSRIQRRSFLGMKALIDTER